MPILLGFFFGNVVELSLMFFVYLAIELKVVNVLHLTATHRDPSYGHFGDNARQSDLLFRISDFRYDQFQRLIFF